VADLLDVARGQMSAFNCGDVEAFVDQFTEDAEWLPLRSETEGPYRGHDGLRAWFADSAETFESLHADVDSAHEVPGGVIAFGALDVKGRGSHAAVRVPIAWYFRLRGDKIRWARAYSDRAAALRDAGVTEDSLR
jgi:ketosteroid isomerase-like protein